MARHPDLCDNCGASYGEHRGMDSACPPDEETHDYLSKWKLTKFKIKKQDRVGLRSNLASWQCPNCGKEEIELQRAMCDGCGITSFGWIQPGELLTYTERERNKK